jgi:hypothetical protein
MTTMQQHMINKIDATTAVLQTNSPSFKKFIDSYDEKLVNGKLWQGMMNYFVNVDAHKDNHMAFNKGSNDFFKTPHTAYPQLNSQFFKDTMRKIIDDLKKANIAHNLHVYKLKYSAGKKVPPPDMLKYVDKNTNILGCYDCGKKGNEIFGGAATHQSYFPHYKVLCSIANTKIDPGPSGSDCQVHINQYDVPEDVFDLLGYKNIALRQTGLKTDEFELTFKGTPNVKRINQAPSNNAYLLGNGENAKFFENPSSLKIECDYRTTCKKLGDDLQVILSFFYKIFNMEAANIMLIMLTCDLGFTFLSLILGHNIISKEKEDIQSNEYGNYTFIRSVVDNVSGEELERIRRENLKNGIVEQWQDFNTIIQYIKHQIKRPEGAYIQFKGDRAYHLKNMAVTDDISKFFENIYETIKKIIIFINDPTIDLQMLKECVPIRFINVHKRNLNTYLFTSQKQYSKGELIKTAFKNDTYKNGFLMECNKLIKEELLKKNSRIGASIGGTRKKRSSGGGNVDVFKILPQKDFFIEDVIYSELENFKNKILYDFYLQRDYIRDLEYQNLDNLKYDCLSYVDDCMSANPNVENIGDYVNEFIREWNSITDIYILQLDIIVPRIKHNQSISNRKEYIIIHNSRDKARKAIKGRSRSRSRDKAIKGRSRSRSRNEARKAVKGRSRSRSRNEARKAVKGRSRSRSRDRDRNTSLGLSMWLI